MEYLFNFIKTPNTRIQKVNYEDVKLCINNSNYLLKNTLPAYEQTCLIHNTVNFAAEEQIVNNLIKSNKSQIIILYGKNTNDESVYRKYQEFIELGFINVYIYLGGLFEWLLLQDIYGKDLFKTTSDELDIIKFRPPSLLEKKLITNN